MQNKEISLALCSTNFLPSFLSPFSPPKTTKEPPRKKCQLWQRFCVGSSNHGHGGVQTTVTKLQTTVTSSHGSSNTAHTMRLHGRASDSWFCVTVICTQTITHRPWCVIEILAAEATPLLRVPHMVNDQHPNLNSLFNWFLKAILSKGLEYRHSIHEYYALASLIFCATLVSPAASIICPWMIRT